MAAASEAAEHSLAEQCVRCGDDMSVVGTGKNGCCRFCDDHATVQDGVDSANRTIQDQKAAGKTKTAYTKEAIACDYCAGTFATDEACLRRPHPGIMCRSCYEHLHKRRADPPGP